MKRAWAIAVSGVVMLAGCQRPSETSPTSAPEPAAATKPSVLATIFPLADITAQIAGDAAMVEPLMPPGASPHTFELTPAQATMLAGAAAVIRVGPGIDAWVTAMAGDKVEILTLTEHTELLHGFHHEDTAEAAPAEGDGQGAHADPEGHESHAGPEESAGDADPHVWLDLVRMRDDLAPAIAELLTRLVPAEQDAIAQRLGLLQTDLTALDRELTTILAPVKDAAYISAHPAWGYFDARYGLKLAAAIEEAPGRDPSGQRFSALIDQAKAEGVKAVMAEKQQNKALAERLAADIGAKVGLLDPIGGKSIPDCNSYRALLVHNAKVFAEVLAP